MSSINIFYFRYLCNFFIYFLFGLALPAHKVVRCAIFVNIAHYAYKPEIGGVVIRVSVGNEVIIEFEDKGNPYNPLDKGDPDITVGAEEREIGGLGVFMVKNIMDSVEYRHEDNNNILLIKKTVKPN